MGADPPSIARERRLIVLTPYAVLPPRHGPQIRVAGILRNLGEQWRVEHFSQSITRTDLPWPRPAVRGGERWLERRMRDPISAAWLVGLSKIGGYPAAYADRLLALLPHPRVRRALAGADAVLVSPHYQFGWVRRHTPATTPVVVDCHSIEFRLWPPRRPRWTTTVAREIARGERDAYSRADSVLVTSREDGDAATELGARRVALVRNGVDVERFHPAGVAEKAALRGSLGLPATACTAVFVGAAGYANARGLEALLQGVDLWRAAAIDILVVGRVGVGRAAVPGVRFTGEVDDVAPWVRAADIALVPLLDGGGTSLKTIEYMAAGVPVVGTRVGVRGLGVEPGTHAVVGEVGELPGLANSIVRDPVRARAIGEAGRVLAVRDFSWRAVGAAATRELDALVADARGRAA